MTNTLEDILGAEAIVNIENLIKAAITSGQEDVRMKALFREASENLVVPREILEEQLNRQVEELRSNQA